MTVKSPYVVLNVVLVIALILALIGKQEKRVVIPPAVIEGWDSQVTQQVYIVVKAKQITAICSREESARKYADESRGGIIQLGINNGCDTAFELHRDGDVLEFKIASW